MTTPDKTREAQDKFLEILLHGATNPGNADLFCPYIEWMGEDLGHCPGVGEWKCKLQRYEYASDQYGVDSVDYRACAWADHTTCGGVYSKKKDAEKQQTRKDP